MSHCPRSFLMTRISQRQALMMKIPVQVCDGPAAVGDAPTLTWPDGLDTGGHLPWNIDDRPAQTPDLPLALSP
jgi:hypothetical protein